MLPLGMNPSMALEEVNSIPIRTAMPDPVLPFGMYSSMAIEEITSITISTAMLDHVGHV